MKYHFIVAEQKLVNDFCFELYRMYVIKMYKNLY